MGLPLESLTIAPATREQISLSRRNTFEEWGRGLTLEQYLARDAYMETLGYATDGKLTTWVLVPRDNIETTDILSSCESYRRKVVYTLPDRPNDIQTTVGYSIASVFTQPRLRRNGYAKHMMRLLHHVLAAPNLLPSFPLEWGPPPSPRAGLGILSVLYSDVGEDFYSKCGPTPSQEGWKSSCKRTTVWGLEPASPSSPVARSEAIQWLDESAVYHILQEDEIQLINEFSSNLEDGETMDDARDAVRLTFLPADHLVEFQISRTKAMPVVAENSSDTVKRINNKWGVKWENSCGGQALQFAVWSFEYRPTPSRLLISHLRVTEKVVFEQLILAAKQAALDNEVELVEVWDLQSKWVDKAEQLGGKTFERDEHIPSVCWYMKDTNVRWINNERFPWC